MTCIFHAQQQKEGRATARCHGLSSPAYVQAATEYLTAYQFLEKYAPQLKDMPLDLARSLLEDEARAAEIGRELGLGPVFVKVHDGPLVNTLRMAWPKAVWSRVYADH